MVRHIHATLDDESFERAKAGLDGRTWAEAVMDEIAVPEDEYEGEK